MFAVNVHDIVATGMSYLIQIAMVLAGAGVAWAARYAAKRWHIQMQQNALDLVDQMIGTVLNVIGNRATAAIQAHDNKVTVNNAMIAEAVNFLNANHKDLLAKAGLTGPQSLAVAVESHIVADPSFVSAFDPNLTTSAIKSEGVKLLNTVAGDIAVGTLVGTVAATAVAPVVPVVPVTATPPVSVVPTTLLSTATPTVFATAMTAPPIAYHYQASQAGSVTTNNK